MKKIKTSSGANLAFAVVVLSSYLSTFSSFKPGSSLELILLITLGITYLSLGVYGFSYAAQSESLFVRLAYFALQIPLGSLIIILSKGAGLNALVLLPLAGHSVVLLPGLWEYISNTVIAMAFLISIRTFTPDWALVFRDFPTFLAGILFIMIFTQTAVGEESARREVDRLVEDLESANQHLREYTLQIEELTIAKERNRLAREIHDGLGHYLTTIYMQIQASRAIMVKNPDKALSALEKAQTMTQEALADVRRSVAALRTNPEELLPLPQRIQKMILNSGMTGFKSSFECIGKPRILSNPADLALYRAAQEGMNNACKHANPSNFWVTLDYSAPDQTRLTIRDDGIGADHIREGFGLIGLKERILLLNGTVDIQTEKGCGLTLEMTVTE
ncbi:MAG: histidine kinase [Anaerolineaceae bacterium]